jgi:hypothetical protein
MSSQLGAQVLASGRAAFADLERSAVAGLLGHSHETGADYRFESDHGPLLAGLSFSRTPIAGTLGRDRADHSRPSAQTHGTPNDAALVFQCFEGIELLHVQTATASFTIVLRLESVHRLILAVLGPLYEKIYHPSG